MIYMICCCQNLGQPTVLLIKMKLLIAMLCTYILYIINYPKKYRLINHIHTQLFFILYNEF